MSKETKKEQEEATEKAAPACDHEEEIAAIEAKLAEIEATTRILMRANRLV